MFVQVRPPEARVAAGSSIDLEVLVHDTDGDLNGAPLEVDLLGVPSRWVTAGASPADAWVGPRIAIQMRVDVPRHFAAGELVLAVRVRPAGSEASLDSAAFERVVINVSEAPSVRLTVEPSVLSGRRRARGSMIVANDGSSPILAAPYAMDVEGAVRVAFDRARVEVGPNSSTRVGVTADGGRAWFGRPNRRAITLGVEAGARVPLELPVVRPARIGPILSALLFAVLALALLGVSAAPGLLRDREADNPEVSAPIDQPAGLGRLAGSVVEGRVVAQSDGSTIDGAVVELFAADDQVSPVAVAASGVDGVFTLVSPSPGPHLVRLSAAGFTTAWQGGTSRPDAVVDVPTPGSEGGSTVDIGDQVLTGDTGRISGRVTGVDATGSSLSARVLTDDDAEVRELLIGVGGTFELVDLPAPSQISLEVSVADRLVASHTVSLLAGGRVSDVVLTTSVGEGSVVGTVSTEAGGLGGVSVVVSDGSQRWETVSLTQGDIGSFSFEGVPVSPRLTVTATRAGFVSASVVTSFGRDGVARADLRLEPADGSISGVTTIAGGDPVSGVEIAVGGLTGDGSIGVGTVSVDRVGVGAGRFTLSGLTVPGEYVLTFSRDGLVTQTREVTLARDDSRIDDLVVGLPSEDALVSGTVTGPGGAALADASVVLSDGTTVVRTVSADDPAGRFEFSGIAPGEFTLTTRVPGALPVVTRVTVGAGSTVEVGVAVGESSTVTGRVVTGGTPVGSVAVRVFRVVDHPGPASAAVAATVSASDGSFSLSGFDTPGTFVVTAQSPSDPTATVASVVVEVPVATAIAVGDLDVSSD
ncbi:MAG: hypothetical protein EBV88_02925 [Actinobacteria bacterium]|nr:hypothetical protein [Actinomycetota bacterium]